MSQNKTKTDRDIDQYWTASWQKTVDAINEIASIYTDFEPEEESLDDNEKP